MNCVACNSAEVTERPERTAQGYLSMLTKFPRKCWTKIPQLAV